MDFTSYTRVQSNYHQLLTWFLSPKSTYVEQSEPWNIKLFANNLVALHSSLPRVTQGLQPDTIPVAEFAISSLNEDDITYLEPVMRLKDVVHNEFQQDVTQFLVHGSIATLDFCKGWSDLDTFVVISAKTLGSVERLLQFRTKIIAAHSFLLEIDTHQHHGFIFGTEFGLRQYFSHFIPIEVLRRSKSLLGPTTMNVEHRRSKEESVAAFKNKVEILRKAYRSRLLRHHAYNGEYLEENFQNINTMYQLKYFLSVVMTLPTYYLDADGRPCYKKDSFDLVRDKFKDHWEIIDKATHIRAEWPLREEVPYQSNRIPDWVVSTLGNDYFRRAYLLGASMQTALTDTDS